MVGFSLEERTVPCVFCLAGPVTKSCRLSLNGLPFRTANGKIKNIGTGNNLWGKVLPDRYATCALGKERTER